MWQFNHVRLKAHLLFLKKRDQFPQILTIVVIADCHMNGDACGTYRLHKLEKLFILGFTTPAEGAVAVDDQVSGSRIECDYALGRLHKAVRHIHAFMLGLLDRRTRPLRTRVDTVWIGTDVRIRKQGNSVLVHLNTFALRGCQRARGHYRSAAKSERALNELTTSDWWENDGHFELSWAEWVSGDLLYRLTARNLP